MKTKTTVYKCSTATQATDSAQIFYINCKQAQRIEQDREKKQIAVFGRFALLAIFAY